MAIRTKGRARFDFKGRAFVWYVADDRFVRIASADKCFSVAYSWDGVVKVVGPQFAGLSLDAGRPTYLMTPRFDVSNLGALVEAILVWSFNEQRALQVAEPALGGW